LFGITLIIALQLVRLAVCLTLITLMAVRLQFEGIRCFVKPQSAVIRPLTLLVGENSSGKSTFLALCQVASSMGPSQSLVPLFNSPPFALGAYDQIASNMGRSGPVKGFHITLSAARGKRRDSMRVEFIPKDGQPSMRSWELTSGDQHCRVLFDGKTRRPRKNYHIAFDKGEALSSEFGDGIYAFAPTHASPKRTYDPIGFRREPEGSHVPMLLAQLSRPSGNLFWPGVSEVLRDFGSHSGLFDGIEVIRKGKSESDPFQIGVKTAGRTFNLIDVGYGVSQALPILVDMVFQYDNLTFLLQQPEVHLHPRAQAELGSLFAHQIGRKHRFVIETHSDHLIDRVRMEVRKRTLKPEQVSLLYFERQKQGATIHNIELGPDGTILDAPPGYRRFFFDEENRLLDI
jgi:hypothetical protein